MRVTSIDSLRVLAIFAVICIHSHPFPKLHELVNLSASFAVPYFFIVSGYFFSKKLQIAPLVSELYGYHVKRLAVILFAWMLVYLLVPSTNIFMENDVVHGLYLNIREKVSWIFDHPIAFLLRGGPPAGGGHLWFIISLIMAISILSLLAVYNQQNKIFLIAFPLYVFNLLIGAYVITPVGIEVTFQSYEGPFVSTLFVAIGWWLAQSDYKPSLTLAWLTITGGFLSILVEVSMLNYIFNISLNQPYLIGTILFGTGFMFLALAKPDLGQNTFFPYFTLGIYVSHVLILHFFLFSAIYKLKTYMANDLWQLVYPINLSVGLYLLSLVLTMLLAKFPYTKRIVI